MLVQQRIRIGIGVLVVDNVSQSEQKKRSWQIYFWSFIGQSVNNEKNLGSKIDRKGKPCVALGLMSRIDVCDNGKKRNHIGHQ